MNDNSWYNHIHQTLSEIIEKATHGIFDATSALIHNTMSYTVILVTIMVWLIMRLKNGYPTKDEMFNAGKWLMLVLFVYAVFYSYASYTGFASLFMLPANWIKSIVSDAMGFKGSNFIDILNQANNLIHKMCKSMLQQANEDTGWLSFGELTVALNIVSVFFFWVWIIILYIALFGGLLIITGSQFITAILLSASPILIPFIVFKALRAYFFSYLKLVISYSLYPSIALIIISIALSSVDDMKKQNSNTDFIKSIYENTFSQSMPLILITILGIYFMTKIPNWVSQIMGVQGLDGGGTGAAFSAMKSAGGTAGKIGGSGLAGAGGGMIGKGLSGAAAGFAKGGIPGAIGGALKGGIVGAIDGGFKGTSAGIKKNVPGMKSASSIFKMAKNSRGATAKAG